MQRLLPPILLLICALFMVASHQFWPLFVWFEGPWRWLGVVLLIGGIGVAAWHKKLFARRGTNINTFAPPDQLVTEGLFQYSRNPMYLGMVLALLGLLVLLGSLSPLLWVLVFVLTANGWYIPFEERQMQKRFGEDYRVYRERVRRWL